MKLHRQSGGSSTEAGSALLIAIFALLLISVVGIALLVSTGTDSALAGNYRTATGGYYAGIAGLEEARGRLLWKSPDFINKTAAYTNVLFDGSGVLPQWSLTQVLYITNPNTAAGETVDPASANPANYPDTEYAHEFPWGLGGAIMQQIPSVSPAPSIPLPGPNYKWVRINPITEASLNIDVNGDGVLDSVAVLFYDPAHIDPSTGKPAPSLVVSSTPSSPPVPPTPTSVQALEITALAALPSGSRRILQYVVAPVVISPDATDQSFPAALTLDGNGVTFQSPGKPSYQINGVDGCPPPPPGAVQAIGYTNSLDYPPLFAEVNPDKSEYPGAPLTNPPPPPGYTPTTPSLLPTPTILRQSWLTPASLDAVMQDVVKSADVVINKPTATGTDISNNAPGMSISNPMTIVVNGDLNLTGWHNSGYGLLLVTGTLYYDPDASWDGIVLVVGQGILSSSKNGPGGFTGAVFVATTRDSSGNLLSGNMLGAAFFGSKTGGYGGNPGFGINYNSCSINRAKGPLTYKVLSFHEVLLPN
ncbi:MAG: hypothetical protein WBL63_25120 [Candidatus Acidiferrum sp.]